MSIINDGSDNSSNLDSYHSFLQSLIGEEVQVYRGGPESKSGKLLDVQSDYITVYAQNNNNNNNNSNNNNNNNSNNNNNNNNANDNNNNENQNQNTIVYYRTEHLQSISENSKSNSMPRFQNQDEEEEEIPFQTGDNFNELVGKLSGAYVMINQGGPESKAGYILDFSDNYVALLTEDDGVVFYNVQHMKSISEYSQKNNDEDEVEDENNTQEIVIPEYIRADDFHNLFSQMSHKWVSINRGGPEALEGILVQSAGGHYTLINNDEVLRINPYHIKSISCGPKGAMNQYNNSNKDDSSQNSENSEGQKDEDESSNYIQYSTTINLSSSSSSKRSSSSSSSSSSRRSSSSSSRRSSSSSSRRSSSSSSRNSSRKSSSSRKTKSSSSSHRRGRNKRRQRSSSHENIVKTLDYVWNPKK